MASVGKGTSAMDHLSNWIEIPVVDMKRAKRFYSELLGVGLNEMHLGGNQYALIDIKDRFNTGCLAKGDGHVPSMSGVVVVSKQFRGT
jgi:predicted enzyme related to lactoylglutathione lyase